MNYSKIPFFTIPYYLAKKYCQKNATRGFLWGGMTTLGFYRGVRANLYMADEENNNKSTPTEPYMYSATIAHGVFGAFLYWNIYLMPFMIIKEIYRAEVNLRGLEDKKLNNFYKYLIFNNVQDTNDT
jgi:hypothetical protein